MAEFLGLQAQRYMDNGALVPDELMVAIVKERMAYMDVHGLVQHTATGAGIW